MPRFRTGTKVGLNVYDHDRPIFQAHDPDEAENLVSLLNVGDRVETITRDELARLFDDSERWWEDEDFLSKLETAVWRLIVAPDTPPRGPESAPAPTAGTGGPEDVSGKLSGRVEYRKLDGVVEPHARPACRAQTYDTSLVCRKLAGHVGPHDWI